jgi:hypothetical protein
MFTRSWWQDAVMAAWLENKVKHFSFVFENWSTNLGQAVA